MQLSTMPNSTRAIKGFIILVFGLLIGCTNTAEQDLEKTANHKPKNTILMIGDGMGFAYLKAYRLFKDNPDTPDIDLTLFDTILTGAVSTDPKHTPGTVTDSAAAATAYATGFKTKNGAIGVDEKGQKLTTALELASEHRRSTGLVSTSHVNHATPAAFIAHVPSRGQYNDIADAFFDNQFEGQPRVDVILGGGSQFFLRDDRNLIEQFQQAGYQHLENKSDLQAAKGNKLLGLFAAKGLPAAWDREDSTPSLADMTQVALNTLNKNENGFFLMVEGSQIDWGGHGNDILYALSEMEDFEQALAKVLTFIEQNPDTLLILTADHETGGLAIGGNTNNKWDASLLRNIHTTPETLANNIQASNNALETFASITSIDTSDAEAKQLLGALTDHDALVEVIKDIINRASFTGWTSDGHTGIDVPLMSTGAGSEKLKGLVDNTVIGKILVELN